MGRWPGVWPRSAHLIGIGGVAMSGLATILRDGGASVRGTDASIYPPASDMLAESGIQVATPFASENLDPPPDLVIVGNAISPGNPELDRALEQDAPLASLPEVVERLLVPGRRVTVVAGTHGKTTTASMVAHLHHAAGRDPSILVGGRPGNFPTGGRLGRGSDLVLEGDEYDSAFFDKGPKFMHYWPRIAVLGPVEFDHADIYADLAAVERAFSWFVRLVPANGLLVVHGDDPAAVRLAAGARSRVVRCGLGGAMDLSAVERQDEAGGQSFTVLRDGRSLGRARLDLPGAHNGRNALAALAAVDGAGLPVSEAIPLLAGFVPPRRRLELIVDRRGLQVYDDFAHHPTAVAETLRTLRRLAPPGGRLIACLEPRSNTMVRALVRKGLTEALAGADRVLLAPVDRPERFSPEMRLDVGAVVAELIARGVQAEGPLTPDEIAQRVAAEAREGDQVVLMSNGAFGGLAARLEALLAQPERRA